MLSERIIDRQHPDIKHTAFIGGPYTDKYLTNGQRAEGERARFYVDTEADHLGVTKVVRTEFTQLFVANAFIKALKANPEVSVKEVTEMAEAEILLQGRSVEDDRRLIAHNQDIMIEEFGHKWHNGASRDELLGVLNFHLRDVTIKIKSRAETVPYYTELKPKKKD